MQGARLGMCCASVHCSRHHGLFSWKLYFVRSSLFTFSKTYTRINVSTLIKILNLCTSRNRAIQIFKSNFKVYFLQKLNKIFWDELACILMLIRQEKWRKNTLIKRYLKTSYAAVTEKITPNRTQIIWGSGISSECLMPGSIPDRITQ
jgi:hypothetical protein